MVKNFKEITPKILQEYSNVFINPNKNIQDILAYFEGLELEDSKELNSRLFSGDGNMEIIIEGEKNYNNKIMTYPPYVDGCYEELSDIDALEIALRFINLYDDESRNLFNKAMPLIVGMLSLRTKNIIGASSIRYHGGMLTVSFTSYKQFQKNDCYSLFYNNVELKFFEAIGLTNVHDVLDSLTNYHRGGDTQGYWHFYMMVLEPEKLKSCIERTRCWLSCTSELSRKELQKITGYSERSVNDALLKLMKNGEVEMVGNTNAPNVKYKYKITEDTFIRPLEHIKKNNYQK